ncbi:HAMP domain-containing sensor histidine kinase [Lacimicrobium alkaliphilum]|uniref:histidine kinase n=1 Tax=Lacimicrobium alkaliphilum TaxID=1526571 RepID=A0ABQ1R9G0_9ALTE|nr:HAMP domain-containing sensor histidine kinase [Lacimicrobium alkaliphilum]GGD59358.1 sensor histidine kinase [Lacimicrobium alkaliphilum]
MKLLTFSIRRLTLLGFSLVGLPLVVALGLALVRIEQLSVQGTGAIQQVSRLVYVSRQVSQLLNNMERGASQYLVLKDQALWDSYQHLREEFRQLATEMVANNNPVIEPAVAKLLRQEESLHEELAQAGAEFPIARLQRGYSQLNSQSNDLFRLNRRIIDTEIEAIEQKADQLRETLLQSALVIPASMLIAILFVRLITGPINQLKPQIRRLERGDFDRPVTVKGAMDIVEVAEILEAMREKLLTLEKQKTGFIRHISHELKTPLAAIREGAELLYDGTTGKLNPEQEEVSAIIRNSVGRLQQLIEDLLNFNMVLDHAKALKQSGLLGLALQKVIADRQLQIQSKALTVRLPEHDYLLRINPEQLRVILDNLVSNAVKFSPSEGEISITAGFETDTWWLRVADQGPGVPIDDREQVFEPFFQSSQQPQAKVKGSGLGLTITRELIEKYKGSIRLKEASEGCCFEIQFPAILVEQKEYV